MGTKLKEDCTRLWAELRQAMVNDGMMPAAVVETGPQTTAVIVRTVQQSHQGPWLPAKMKPVPGRVVMGLDEHDKLVSVYWSELCDGWLYSADDSGVSRDIVKWCFVELPE